MLRLLPCLVVVFVVGRRGVGTLPAAKAPGKRPYLLNAPAKLQKKYKNN